MREVRLGLFALIIFTLSSCSSYGPEVSSAMMLGEVDVYHLEDMFWFQRNYNQYKPSAECVKNLKGLPEDTRIVFIGGIWHAQSQRMLPQLYKIADQAHIKQDQISVYFIDTELKSPEQWESRYNVTTLPTCIILQNDVEIARMEGTPETTLEQELTYNLTSIKK